jgi:ADP-heptose:LPS heptosyltransferase
VISVDTSMAHLAGALGLPTWVLLSFSPDWRWLRGRSDSPWYPSVTLYRQTRSDDWSGALERMGADLASMGQTGG